MTDDEETRRRVLEHLRGVFAQLAKLPVAARALSVFGKIRPDFAPQMRGKRAALAWSACRLVRAGLQLVELRKRLSLDHASTQVERELLMVDGRLLRLRSELCAP